MDPALRAAATGMMAQQTRTEVIANNLANVNTTAFKRSRAHFVDLLYQTMQGGASTSGGESSVLPSVQIGRGTRLAGVLRNQAQGSLEQTDRPLDLAIEGEGYFQVQMPSGQLAYTRDGTFQLSDTGTLVTSGGQTVAPGIRVPRDVQSVQISPAGIVSVLQAKSTMPVEIGRIEIARFANPSGLEAQGENLYFATPAAGEAITGFPQDEGMGRLLQGQLEASNVEIVQEMVDMISAQRAYEINSKAIKNSDEMSQIASGLIR